jgi:hypothetical protein
MSIDMSRLGVVHEGGLVDHHVSIEAVLHSQLCGSSRRSCPRLPKHCRAVIVSILCSRATDGATSNSRIAIYEDTPFQKTTLGSSTHRDELFSLDDATRDLQSGVS